MNNKSLKEHHSKLIDQYMLSLQTHLCKLSLIDNNDPSSPEIKIPYFPVSTNFQYSAKHTGTLKHNDYLLVLGVSSDTLLKKTSLGEDYRKHQNKLLSLAHQNMLKAKQNPVPPQQPTSIESLRFSGQPYTIIAISPKGELIALATYSSELVIA